VHRSAYAAVVLSGCYEEAGDSGRHQVSAGHVLLHDAHEGHLNRFRGCRATVLNLPLPGDCLFRAGLAQIDDPDAIVHLAEKDGGEAAAQLVASLQVLEPKGHDWPDELAADLLRDASVSLSWWSEANGLAAWEVSRGFAQVFEISPSAFRARARTRQAWRAIRATDAPLAAIAAECGFADQAHMTRSIKAMTGESPTMLRQACK
jgi:AraC-like DNA-binding protein